MTAIAIVEDDESILDATKLLIELHGWEPRPYADAESFLADQDRVPACDCLLLDPHLPGKSGLDVARAMAGSPMPIVVITARPDSAVTRAILALGACAVITKPVGDQQLLAVIAGLLPLQGNGGAPPS